MGKDCLCIRQSTDQTWTAEATDASSVREMVFPRQRIRVINMFMDMCHLPMEFAIALDGCIIRSCTDHGSYAREATRICHNVLHNPALSRMDPVVLCSLSNDESMSMELRRHLQVETDTALGVQSMLKEKYASSVSVNDTGVLLCRICKGSDVSFQQKQTRGADEAMTIYCVCACGARWKMS